MPGKNSRPQIKDEKMYESIKRQGASKEKAARIANAASGTSRENVGRKGGESPSYEDWTVDDLRERAGEIDIKGRSRMNKKELINALRHH